MHKNIKKDPNEKFCSVLLLNRHTGMYTADLERCETLSSTVNDKYEIRAHLWGQADDNAESHPESSLWGVCFAIAFPHRPK